MASVVKIGHVSLRTSDLDRMVAYYTEVLDFDLVDRGADAAYLAADIDHHCVAIMRAPAAEPVHLAFQIAGSIEDAEADLAKRGIAAERRTDPEPGIGALLRICDPEGNPLDLYPEIEHRRQRSATRRPQKLGHVCYFVGDVGRTVDFYREVLGFRWSDSIGDFFVFLRCAADHHTINLLRSDRPRRIHHIAYEMRDVSHVQQALDALGATTEHKVVWGPGRHGPGHNLFSYHRDPDQTTVELFTQLDVMLDERLGYYEPRPWHEDSPQRPKVWQPGPWVGNAWGPPAPEGFR